VILPFELEFNSPESALGLADGRAGLRLPIPLLDGPQVERILEDVQPAGESNGFRLYSGGGLLIGYSVESCGAGTAEGAARLYRRLLAAAGPNSLYRIWNYLPEINRWKDGLENYRAFSAGRSKAFEEVFGQKYRDLLPAASAVGCQGEFMAAVFVAGRAASRNIENPEQVPAYDYPPEHGPRSPAFSRASVVEAAGRRLVFISGTAAIKGHRTVCPEEIQGQLDCTLDNLDLIFRAAGVDLGGTPGRRRHFRVYLRNARDLAVAKSRLEARLRALPEKISWLEAPLCRKELLVEVEATVVF
jgi:enamine deaminase RidA (YjgF/YER057c/UK114 family)